MRDTGITKVTYADGSVEYLMSEKAMRERVVDWPAVLDKLSHYQTNAEEPRP